MRMDTVRLIVYDNPIGIISTEWESRFRQFNKKQNTKHMEPTVKRIVTSAYIGLAVFFNGASPSQHIGQFISPQNLLPKANHDYSIVAGAKIEQGTLRVKLLINGVALLDYKFS